MDEEEKEQKKKMEKNTKKGLGDVILVTKQKRGHTHKKKERVFI